MAAVDTQQQPLIFVAPDRPGVYGLAFAEITLEIDAAVGARVTAFRLGAHNVLSERTADPDNYGSTFWTSPQLAWGWPPVAEIDSAPYSARAEGAALVMTGTVSARLGLGVEKRFVARPDRRAVEIAYRIHNAGSAVARVAPWEVTRVHPRGLAFFPTGEGVYPPSNLPVVEDGGATWFAYDPARITGHPKLWADASAGWIAHVDGRALFLKTFPQVPRVEQAPGEAVVEIYAHPAHTYVEIEQQGACVEIVPGAEATWAVAWYLRRLPDDVTVAVGSQSLLAFVAAVLAGQR